MHNSQAIQLPEDHCIDLFRDYELKGVRATPSEDLPESFTNDLLANWHCRQYVGTHSVANRTCDSELLHAELQRWSFQS
jgi:hypothetical protein